ncbi:MAG: hypothetical protein NT013_15060 [Planctomycetia bacterium]|nr:hypothetical protein [Planctomycetia bacterium]
MSKSPAKWPRQPLRFLATTALASLSIVMMTSVRDAFAADIEHISLRYKFQANQSQHFEYSQEMTFLSRKRQFQEQIKSQTSADKHLRIISVDTDGNALIEPVIDRVRMVSSKDEEPETKFDSLETAKDPESCPPGFRGIMATVGKPIVQIRFSPQGKVLSANGINGGAAAANGLENDSSLNFLIVLPDQPVKVGDTWKDDFEVNVQIDKSLKQGIKLRREYRLAKLDGSRVEIELKMGTITPINSPEIDLQISSRIMSGTIVFEHQLGQIVSRNVTVDREVINALGAPSLVHTSIVQRERLVPNPKLAKRDAK